MNTNPQRDPLLKKSLPPSVAISFFKTQLKCPNVSCTSLQISMLTKGVSLFAVVGCCSHTLLSLRSFPYNFAAFNLLGTCSKSPLCAVKQKTCRKSICSVHSPLLLVLVTSRRKAGTRRQVFFSYLMRIFLKSSWLGQGKHLSSETLKITESCFICSYVQFSLSHDCLPGQLCGNPRY